MNVTSAGTSSVAAGSAARVSVRARSECQAQSAPRRGEDTVEVSSMASLLSKQAQSDQGPPIRGGLVDRVRREIAAGTYDANNEKLDIALDRMIDELL